MDCVNLCLGGLREICNGYGVCSVINGICECELYWKGNILVEYNVLIDENNFVLLILCSRCIFGWIGVDCVIVEDFFILDNFFIFRIVINFGDFYFMSVIGVNFYFEVFGVYYFFNLLIVDV